MRIKIGSTYNPTKMDHEDTYYEPNHTITYVPVGTNGTPIITQDGKP
jgi:uncharacterized secreted protein with C-terminal beta-propeller domain